MKFSSFQLPHVNLTAAQRWYRTLAHKKSGSWSRYWHTACQRAVLCVLWVNLLIMLVKDTKHCKEFIFVNATVDCNLGFWLYKEQSSQLIHFLICFPLRIWKEGNFVLGTVIMHTSHFFICLSFFTRFTITFHKCQVGLFYPLNF